MDEDDSQKEFDPSQKKLDDARKRGDVPKSSDAATTLVLVAGFGVILAIGGNISKVLALYAQGYIQHAGEIEISSGSVRQIFLDIGYHVGLALSMLLGAMGFAAIVGHVGQTGIMFVGEKIMPKPEKISPISGFKRLFGKDSLIQFLKNFLKLLVLAIVAFKVVEPHFKEVANLVDMEVPALLGFLMKVLKELVFKLLVVMGIFSGADYFLQRMSFMKRNKMSKQEMKEEFKQSEGDPMIAGKLKQLRMQKAKQRMMQNVQKASVVITNPTHYAVALKYEAGVMNAPVCVAKGIDAVALKIREVATEHDIPIIEDRPLARALYAQVDIDDQIPAEFFQAVAKIIGSIMSVAAKKKK